MSAKAVAAASLVSAACLAASCGGPHPCKPAKCPTATSSLRLLEDSTVTWSFAGSPPQTMNVVPRRLPDPSATTDCGFWSTAGSIYRQRDAGTSTLIEGSSYVQCVAVDAARFDIGVSRLGDFRDWPAGTFTVEAPPQKVGLDYYPTTAPPPGPAGKECPVATFLDGIALTVNVETATGSEAPYPQLVTSDFVRTFRLDFDTTSVQARDATGAACDFALALQVSLHFTQTAADYVYDADAPCVCQ